MAEEIEIFRATLNDESDWREGPAHVNRLIAAKIAEVEDREKKEDPRPPEPEFPAPPPPRAASIQPEIIEGRVAVPPRPAQVTFDPSELANALSALKGLFVAVAEEAAEYPQVDRRAAAHLEAVARRLADTRPTHRDFFAVGFEYDVLKGYSGTVEAEWPELLARKYEVAVTGLGQALSRFPAWAEFKKNLGDAPQDISPEDIETVVELTRRAIEELRAPENSGIVDPTTPDAIEQVLAEIHDIEMEVGPEGARGAEAAAERIADLLEGLANTAKSFLQLCRERITAAGGRVVRAFEAGKRFGKGASDRVKEKVVDFNDNAERYGGKYADHVMKVVAKTFGPFVASAIMNQLAPGSEGLAFLAVLLAMNRNDNSSPPPAEGDGKPKRKTPPKKPTKRGKSTRPPKTEQPPSDEMEDGSDSLDPDDGDMGEG